MRCMHDDLVMESTAYHPMLPSLMVSVVQNLLL